MKRIRLPYMVTPIRWWVITDGAGDVVPSAAFIFPSISAAMNLIHAPYGASPVMQTLPMLRNARAM